MLERFGMSSPSKTDRQGASTLHQVNGAFLPAVYSVRLLQLCRYLSLLFMTARGGSDTCALMHAQIGILAVRFSRSWMRSPASLCMQAAQYLLAALLIGASKI